MSLSNSAFLNSYYQAFRPSWYLLVEGIVFIILSLILFVASLFLRNRKLTAECLALVSMVQLFGLSRVRDAPYDFDLTGVLEGFSYYEMSFVPNVFANPFYEHNYSEAAVDSAVFALGSQNLVLNFGSIFYFFLGLQLILLVYLAVLLKRKRGVGHDERS